MDGSVSVTVDKSTVDVNVLGSYTVTYSATDNAGNTTSEPRTVIVADATAPAAPTLTGTTPTKDNTPELSGTAEASSTVTVYSGDTALGQATADAGGAYTVIVSTLADGIHSLTAKATDASGNTGAASAALAIEVDTAAPPVPTVTANSPSSTGTPVISGVAEASSTVTVYSGDTALGQASADGGGAYSFTPATTLEDGTYSISATATDGAGNTGAASTAMSLMVDTVVPGAPVLSVTTPTNDSTPEMGGTAEAGATVTIYTGGTQLGQTTATGGG